MASLGVGELEAGDQAAGFAGIVVSGRGLQSLAQGRGLPELTAKPTEKADTRTRCHATRLSDVDAFLAIASRRDERRYLAGPLPDETVTRILDAGRLSGSSQNRQPWTFVVPTSPARVRALAEAVWVPENLESAGLVVAIVVPTGRSAFDAGRAAQNMLLAAWNEGIASCPNGVRDVDAARSALELDDAEEPAIVLSFGRPGRPRDPASRAASDWSGRANRRPLEELVRRVA